MAIRAISDMDYDDDLVPNAVRRPQKTRGTAFAALHGAYHVLNRRVAMELRDHRLSASEAVVLEALRRYPMATISVVRRATGLRASTLDSLLDRLQERDVLLRDSPRGIPSEVTLLAAPRGRLLTEYCSAALTEVDEELSAFVGRTTLGVLDVIFEATRALGVPGTAADF